MEANNQQYNSEENLENALLFGTTQSENEPLSLNDGCDVVNNSDFSNPVIPIVAPAENRCDELAGSEEASVKQQCTIIMDPTVHGVDNSNPLHNKLKNEAFKDGSEQTRSWDIDDGLSEEIDGLKKQNESSSNGDSLSGQEDWERLKNILKTGDAQLNADFYAHNSSIAVTPMEESTKSSFYLGNQLENVTNYDNKINLSNESTDGQACDMSNSSNPIEGITNAAMLTSSMASSVSSNTDVPAESSLPSKEPSASLVVSESIPTVDPALLAGDRTAENHHTDTNRKELGPQDIAAADFYLDNTSSTNTINNQCEISTTSISNVPDSSQAIEDTVSLTVGFSVEGGLELDDSDNYTNISTLKCDAPLPGDESRELSDKCSLHVESNSDEIYVPNLHTFTPNSDTNANDTPQSIVSKDTDTTTDKYNRNTEEYCTNFTLDPIVDNFSCDNFELETRIDECTSSSLKRPSADRLPEKHLDHKSTEDIPVIDWQDKVVEKEEKSYLCNNEVDKTQMLEKDSVCSMNIKGREDIKSDATTYLFDDYELTQEEVPLDPIMSSKELLVTTASDEQEHSLNISNTTPHISTALETCVLVPSQSVVTSTTTNTTTTSATAAKEPDSVSKIATEKGKVKSSGAGKKKQGKGKVASIAKDSDDSQLHGVQEPDKDTANQNGTDIVKGKAKTTKLKKKGKKNKFDTKDDSQNLKSSEPVVERRRLIRGQKWKENVSKYRNDNSIAKVTSIKTDEANESSSGVSDKVNDMLETEENKNIEKYDSSLSVGLDDSPTQTLDSLQRNKNQSSHTEGSVTNEKKSITQPAFSASAADTSAKSDILSSEGTFTRDASESIDSSVSSTSYSFVDDSNVENSLGISTAKNNSSAEMLESSNTKLIPLDKTKTRTVISGVRSPAASNNEATPGGGLDTKPLNSSAVGDSYPFVVKVSEVAEIEHAEREYLSSTSDSTNQSTIDDNEISESQETLLMNKDVDEKESCVHELLDTSLPSDLNNTKDSIDSNEDYAHYVIDNEPIASGDLERKLDFARALSTGKPVNSNDSLEAPSVTSDNCKYSDLASSSNLTFSPPVYVTSAATVSRHVSVEASDIRVDSNDLGEIVYTDRCDCETVVVVNSQNKDDVDISDDIAIPGIFEEINDGENFLTPPPESPVLSNSPRPRSNSSGSQGSDEHSQSASRESSVSPFAGEHAAISKESISPASGLSRSSTMVKSSHTSPNSGIVLPSSVATGVSSSALALPSVRKISRKKVSVKKYQQRLERRDTEPITPLQAMRGMSAKSCNECEPCNSAESITPYYNNIKEADRIIVNADFDRSDSDDYQDSASSGECFTQWIFTVN